MEYSHLSNDSTHAIRLVEANKEINKLAQGLSVIWYYVGVQGTMLAMSSGLRNSGFFFFFNLMSLTDSKKKKKVFAGKSVSTLHLCSGSRLLASPYLNLNYS